MKFRQTVQLGAALFLLILIYFGAQFLGRQSEHMAQEAKRLFDFAPADIHKLAIHQLDSAPTVAERPGGGAWAIVEPNPTIPPYEPLWNRVAESLAHLKNERDIHGGDIDEAMYGLAVPRLTVTAEAAGREHALRLGYLDPTQTFRYASLDGKGVFLVDKNTVFELDRSLDLLRDSFVLDNAEAPLVHLEFSRFVTATEAARMENPPPIGEESAIVIVERPDGASHWQQTSPVQVAANQESVNALADELRGARGRGHIDAPESLADYGLEPPAVRLSVMDADGGRHQTFYFGDLSAEGEKGGIYVRKEGSPSVFLMDAHIMTLFPRTTNSFRERRLLTRLKGPVKIERISGDTSYTVALDEGGLWQMTSPPLDDTDPFYVNQYINALKVLEGVRFFPGAPSEYGLDTPEATFRFSLEGAEEPVEIRLAPSADIEGHYYVETDAGEVASLPEEHIQFLLADAQSFRDRSLLRFDRGRATRLDFTLDGTEYALEKQHDRWLVVEPAGHFMPNQRDAADLLAAAADLRAIGAEADDPQAAAEYDLDNPRFAITVTLAPLEAGGAPEIIGPLTVGGIVPGLDQQRFARSAARDGIFRIPQTFIEAVQASVMGIRVQPAGAGQR